MADNIAIAVRYSVTVCGAVAVVENLLAMAVFARTKNLRMKYFAFIFNRVMTDFMFGLFIVQVIWIDSPILQSILTASYSVSILTIFAAAVNRYLALSIMPPARYDSLVTGYRLLGVCFLFWCFGLIYGFLLHYAYERKAFFTVKTFGYSVGVFIAWVFTALTYFLAFRKIKQYSLSHAGVGADKERDYVRVKQTRRLLIVFVLILVTSFFSRLPFAVFSLIAYCNRSFLSNQIFSASFEICVLLYALSTVINPLIYWWRLDGFRAGFYEMFCRCCIKAKPRETEVKQIVGLYDNTADETGL
ncbi:melanocortin receptor 3-like isoform X1 [Acanthaster planci]|uniref:Melanocortin receptor 3-like isoform X1 n=1 Tax=Acanthaster planci TaxID=133434 RepID=A0A8B7XN15_ACAPL|nr:melanocortin receptor 3-like isoform X1 [Acanthaster planci]XP_022081558.1 melanocortin receptor 3-like isoform X1 [Acanthaster planci]XP_022081559.1 melanocortin receptor 3-like isoform X1 [Acanthaster planci]XP_022081560.1 melanocortin receptor 3-like isoform X1 [Acanthaster planci]XP_022081561.1 melanocortin receptor 3-like isoform X1 [Acanthaster planci]XP_022081562.1 melanocortin receptor 3-like isoform X1 [Acanthaster planci]XP_022081563.1 melanocortin receptor 3-like isoform X1 [Aca